MTEIIVPSTWRERLDSVAGRRRDAWLVAGLVAVVALGALALWQRGAPARIAPPARSGAGATQSDRSPAAAAPRGVVLVHVAGEVRRPGLYELDLGARVADAVRAAGGPRPRGDLDAVNLAAPVSDGDKLEVPVRGRSPVAAPPGAPAASATASAAPVDINQADLAALDTIPGIGPVTAAAILDHRSEIGAFTSVDELLEVSGIGPVTLEEMRPYVTI